MGGNRRLALLKRALAPRGILILVGGEQGRGALTGGMGRAMLAPLAVLGSSRRMVALLAAERSEDLDELRGLIESGAVTPVVDRAYPLERAADAMRHLAQGHPAGKVVVTVVRVAHRREVYRNL